MQKNATKKNQIKSFNLNQSKLKQTTSNQFHTRNDEFQESGDRVNRASVDLILVTSHQRRQELLRFDLRVDFHQHVDGGVRRIVHEERNAFDNLESEKKEEKKKK
jgi:hypothetical protein